jgi:hypothetical protein
MPINAHSSLVASSAEWCGVCLTRRHRAQSKLQLFLDQNFNVLLQHVGKHATCLPAWDRIAGANVIQVLSRGSSSSLGDSVMSTRGRRKHRNERILIRGGGGQLVLWRNPASLRHSRIEQQVGMEADLPTWPLSFLSVYFFSLAACGAVLASTRESYARIRQLWR